MSHACHRFWNCDNTLTTFYSVLTRCTIPCACRPKRHLNVYILYYIILYYIVLYYIILYYILHIIYKIISYNIYYTLYYYIYILLPIYTCFQLHRSSSSQLAPLGAPTLSTLARHFVSLAPSEVTKHRQLDWFVGTIFTGNLIFFHYIILYIIMSIIWYYNPMNSHLKICCFLDILLDILLLPGMYSHKYGCDLRGYIHIKP
jgi:hypothetical protein